MTAKAEPAALLLEYRDLLLDLEPTKPILDLACGTGRNGLALAEAGLPVVFADRSQSALETVAKRLEETGLTGRTWQVDLEQPGKNVLIVHEYAAIIGFCYLHRPLFPAIRQAVIAGGLVIYETFTTDQPRFGHPHNPDFLLRPGELPGFFKGWRIIHYFEGTRPDPDRGIASIVARKTASSDKPDYFAFG